MDSANIVADPIHFFNNENYSVKEMIKHIYVVEEKETQQIIYLIKKGEKYIPNSKNLFIDQLEKSFTLIHPSIINLSGYSVEKPYIYYKYSEEPLNINNIKLTDENIQKIFLGIASGLSYLLSKGYYCNNFSINCVLFDKKCYPKIIDYVDFESENHCSEKDLVIKYGSVLQFIINKQIEKDSSKPINEELKSLIGRCQEKANIPSFEEFIIFFTSSAFRGEFKYISNNMKKYIEILELHDKIIFDSFLSQKINSYKHFDSIEQIGYYIFKNRKIKILNDDHFFILNSLSDYHIKQLFKTLPSLSNETIRYCLYNDDMTLIIPDWKKICDSKCNKNSFQIYKVLMKHIKILEKQKYENLYSTNKINDIDFKIDSLKNQAIAYLKEANKQSDDFKVKIELATQYIKGDILVYNLKKAFNILDKINSVDMQTKVLINQMKEKISSTMNLLSVENLTQKIGEKQKAILQNALKWQHQNQLMQ